MRVDQEPIDIDEDDPELAGNTHVTHRVKVVKARARLETGQSTDLIRQ